MILKKHTILLILNSRKDMMNEILQEAYGILEYQFKISVGRITDEDEINQSNSEMNDFVEKNPDILTDRFNEYKKES